MNSRDSISQQIETYLERLGKVLRQWQSWLAQFEGLRYDLLPIGAASFPGSPLEQTSIELFDQLRRLIADRQQILAVAHDTGAPANSLQSLAQHLPLWHNPKFRASFESLQLQMSHLTRTHLSSWVTLRQSADYCDDALLLMMSGTTRSDITIDQVPPESGGHLLDASL